MLAALIAMTFVAGVFAGIIILAMIFVYIVNRDEKKMTLGEKMENASTYRYEKHDGKWSNPILND